MGKVSLLQKLFSDFDAVAFNVREELTHKYPIGLCLFSFALYLRQLQFNKSLNLSQRVLGDVRLSMSSSVERSWLLWKLNPSMIGSKIKYHYFNLINFLCDVLVLIILSIVSFGIELFCLIFNLLISNHCF